MKRGPRPPKESIFAHGVGTRVIWVGLWIGVVTVAGFAWALDHHGSSILSPSEEALLRGRTVAFSVLALSQIFLVAAIHAGDASFLKAPLRRNPLLWVAVMLTILLQLVAIYTPVGHRILDTISLNLTELAVVMALSASIFPAVEVEKFIRRRRARRRV